MALDDDRVTLSYTAVIPTRNRAGHLPGAVATLLAQTRRPARIVVVDASDEPLTPGETLTRAVAQAGVELVVVHAEPSTAGQRNRGVERAETPLVLLLDDDVALQDDYVEVLLERWRRAGLNAFGAMVGAPDYMPPQGPFGRMARRALMLHYQAPRGRATTIRRSRKLRLVPVPPDDVIVPTCGAGFGLFRTDLLRRHPFDERFSGYAPGEDLDMSFRLGAEAPILQVPAVRYLHAWDPRERTSPARWYLRGRRETYFRLRHLERSVLSRAAFALSVLAEAAMAGIDSARERDPRHVSGFLRGVAEALRERAKAMR